MADEGQKTKTKTKRKTKGNSKQKRPRVDIVSIDSRGNTQQMRGSVVQRVQRPGAPPHHPPSCVCLANQPEVVVVQLPKKRAAWGIVSQVQEGCVLVPPQPPCASAQEARQAAKRHWAECCADQGERLELAVCHDGVGPDLLPLHELMGIAMDAVMAMAVWPEAPPHHVHNELRLAPKPTSVYRYSIDPNRQELCAGRAAALRQLMLGSKTSATPCHPSGPQASTRV